MKRRAPWVMAWVAASLLGAAPSWAGSGSLLGPGDLPPPARAALRRQVARAQATDRATFDRLRELRRDMDLLDAHKRGPIAPVAPLLKALGPRALLPLIERVALDAPGRQSLSPSAWLAWRLGLIEALGAQRDGRAEPVLLALLERPPREPALWRAAAVAYAKLGTDEVAQRLIRQARGSGAERRIALEALGHCRRRPAARHLARAMAATTDEADALVVARALGTVGSAWAWRTPVIARSGEEQPVRSLAAHALVAAYAHASAPLRRMVAKAVWVVDHPETPSLIRAAQRGASPEERRLLGELLRRFEESPLRR